MVVGAGSTPAHRAQGMARLSAAGLGGVRRGNAWSSTDGWQAPRFEPSAFTPGAARPGTVRRARARRGQQRSRGRPT